MAADSIITIGAKLDPKGITSGADRASRSLKRLAVAGVALGVTMAFIGKKLLLAGSDALETRNKFLVTFGSMSASVDAFVQDFNQISGLSKATAENILADTAAIAQSFDFSQKASAEFSTEVLKLAGDLASFKNVNTADAALAITSALTGEREQLKRLGVVLRQVDVDQRALTNTGKESVSQLTNQDRATASLQLITKAAGVAIGDLERTSDSTANVIKQLGAAWRDLNDKLGTFLANSPLVNAFLIGLRDLVKNMVTILGGTGPQIKEGFSILGKIAGNAFSAAVLGAMRTLFQSMASKLAVISRFIGSSLGLAFQSVANLFTSSFDDAMENVSGGLLELKDLAASVKIAPTPDSGGGVTPPPASDPSNLGTPNGFVTAWKRAIENTQDAFAGFFKSLATDGVSSFKDFATRILDVWLDLQSQLLATKLFSSVLGTAFAAVAPSGATASVASAGPTAQLVAPKPAQIVVSQTVPVTVITPDSKSFDDQLESRSATIAKIVRDAILEVPGFAVT